MILYIVRHAIAAPWQPGVADKDRELTREGIAKMKKAAAGLAAVEAIPDVILSSPLIRARQTAEILMAAFGDRPFFQVVPALAPQGNRTELYDEIRKHGGKDGVMLVGHEPSLGSIACEILSGSPGCFLNLKKGSACAIEIAKMSPVPSGFLRWLIPPATLRMLG
jgi:phosphohistidine phosphatase